MEFVALNENYGILFCSVVFVIAMPEATVEYFVSYVELTAKMASPFLWLPFHVFDRRSSQALYALYQVDRSPQVRRRRLLAVLQD